MKFLLAAIAALVLWPASITAAQASPVPAALAQAIDDYNRATVAKDVAKLSTLVTDDYVLVNSDSSVQDKASYLADFRVPNFIIDPYKIERPIYKVYGSTALSSWVMQLSWTQDGKHQSRMLRIAHFWTKERGRWRIEYTQLTRVPD